MGWNKLYFGVNAPSRGKRITVHAMLIVLALTFYGFWIDFIPEPWVVKSAFHVSLVLGVVIAAWTAWFNLSGRNEVTREMGAVKAFLLAPLVGAMGAGFIWFALARGVAGGITRICGNTSFLPSAQMHTEHHWRRRECDYQLKGDAIHSFPFDYLCTSSAYYRAHPDHRVEVELAGRSGWLGFYVTGFNHRRDLGAYRR